MSPQSPALFHLKWVAKVALLVGGVAAAALLLAILLITDDNGTDYAHVLANHSLTQRNLTPTLWAFGLALVVIAATTTWLIALYSSFRMAGPLFRLSENLKSCLADPLVIPLAIRKSDLLQHEWQQFDASQSALRQHYGELHQALAVCEQALAKVADVEGHAELGSEPNSVRLERSARTDCPELGSDPNSALQQAITQLVEVERRVQL